MLKDDRMMGMLTFVVIMLAVGTFAQRTDFVQRLLGTAEPVTAELKPDVAEARVNQRATIDVLANDGGVTDPAGLVIVTPPECGTASVRNGGIRYTPTSACLGAQVLRYGVGADGPTAELRITVRPADDAEGEVRTVIRPGEPRTTISLSAPDEQPPAAAGREDAPAAGAEGSDTAPSAELAAIDREAPARTPEVPAGAAGASVDDSGGPADGGDTAASPSRTAPGATETRRRAAAEGEACTLPPTLTLAAKPGAVTEVSVDAPCHRDSVAVLAYDGLRFAIPLNSRGAGSLAVPGFQRSSDATITLGESEEIGFNLAFEGIERIERVAIAWEEPAALALNAFEFGARPGAPGHLTPGAPRSFEAVRREGGGWLASYEPEAGKGQRIDVYSFWRRHAGPSGVVRLALGPSGGGPCEAGPPGRSLAAADYVVLRSIGGRPERARLGRVAPLDCTELAGGPGLYIENAVDDLIVRRR